MSENQIKPASRLWTRDFTIITVGSIISMLGSTISGFALGLMVLDYTGSTFYYALFVFLFTLPSVIMPLIAGPYLDKYSRKRTIYTLDFISSSLYLFFAASLIFGFFNFPLLAAGTFIIGAINSVYRVAYTSFYPLLIPEGNYQKAYSIASILEVMTAFAVPISKFLYDKIGLAPLLIANAITYFCAAVMETQIKHVETYNEARHDEAYGIKKYIGDFKEGLGYLVKEKGLLAITTHFTVISVLGGVGSVVMLPYFKNTFNNGEYLYMIIGGASMMGRLLGGSAYYKFKIPASRKFMIALIAYVVSAMGEGIILFLPFKIMAIVYFISGLLSVTSYNIRIASTQAYVPHEKKGRFNGTFEMLNTSGALIGEIIAGALSVFTGERTLMLIFGILTATSALVVIGGNRKHVAKIYNRAA
ncbi:MAG: MFS transporter [Lachnospiraceae bacterium]|nr:MFS transporter [Lachnospiraceae bacterium]